MALIELTPSGIYCRKADVFIDPWKPVDKAIITHAHADHARWGMKHYLAHKDSEQVMRLRIGEEISLETLSYNEPLQVNGVKISLHPAGHIPGSSQVRLEHRGQVTVITGDYKIEDDGLCTPFESIKCHELVSECTFGLPVYQWEAQARVFEKINSWWRNNATKGRNSVLFAYALGKAQRIIQHLDPGIGEIFAHGAVWNTNQALIANGLNIRDIPRITQDIPKNRFKGALIIAPPSAMGTPWMKKFSPYRTGICSGWMSIRGTRRRRAADTGFVLSDHSDWNGLVQAVKESEAEKVYLTHGNTASFARYLVENEGIEAVALETLFGQDPEDNL